MQKLLCLLLLFFTRAAYAQQNPYSLKIISTKEAYTASISADSNNRLVEIRKAIPSIRLDIRYATKNNFTRRVMYPEARAFARLPVVKALRVVQQELKPLGLGLKIFDAYRPYAITLKFYEVATDKAFVADPAKGSKHNRGCAVDLTIVDLKTGKEIQMATGYDSFSPKAAAAYPNVPEEVRKNRDLLISVMEKHGFRVIENEWWHFDFTGWKNYDLMDVSFREI
ncbi:M15 family metallopeptidase [Hufsiella ginkgonis]|uniref:D-alanyl-D-alanine dipeptidase n=1 Tax=Hufsiella ginkgonis TaxID=2695274 RepID=A0A7K1XVR2_9SPHI|nr:M15 family metallopeptidase [Hufsiella ginkgonis]MXV14898.1 D-alanyl-D-alanine dipeptidase [Hufsiella ginkgonis]